MAESLHDNEELMRYLDGLMDADEKAAFENQLQQDPGLQQQLENMKVAVEAVRQFATREKVGVLHRQMVKELQPQPSQGKVVKINSALRYTMAIAASVLLIIVGVRTFNHFHNSPTRLFDEAFVDYSISNERGVKENTTPIETDYKIGEYNKITSNANVVQLSQKDSFLVALSFLKTNQVGSSIQWFEHINQGSAYYKDAQFYLSLAYLKNKDYKRALALMTMINRDPDHPYHGNISDALVEKVEKLQ
jgi:TolA-binding protein